MKDSICGRIVSQKKHQSTLLKQYDTSSSINYNRIGQLKNKYMQMPSHAPLTTMQNRQLFSPALITEKIKKQHDMELHIMMKNSNKEVNQFRRKAEQANTNIAHKLDYLEEQIQQLKRQQIHKEMPALPPISVMPPIPTTRTIEVPESIEFSHVQQNANIKNFSELIQSSKKKPQTQRSLCPLALQVDEAKQFSYAYTLFINRLKEQISLDIEFTNILLSLNSSSRAKVTQYITSNFSNVDASFFIVSPLEQDPLQPEVKTNFTGQIQDMGTKLYKFYMRIEEYFKTKLFHSFDTETIQTLFEEIGGQKITLGHLTSYINLRTNREFRNRNLIKLLKRMNIGTNQIDRAKFKQVFIRQ